jgi:hypothetical protein
LPIQVIFASDFILYLLKRINKKWLLSTYFWF